MADSEDARSAGAKRAFVRLHGSLRDLLGARARDEPFDHRFDVSPSVKDVVESVGVPHPEIGVILIDGRPVAWSERVSDRAEVDAYPYDGIPGGLTPTVADPVPPVRFVADVHLGALARRLRIFGFDVRYRNDAADDDLAEWAVGEGRVLLTRDRGLLMRSSIRHGYVPRSDSPDDQVVEVVRRFRLQGEIRLSTRCPACNGRLTTATAEEVARGAPERSREAFDDFRRCVDCGQIYWPGSHLQHLQMLARRAREA